MRPITEEDEERKEENMRKGHAYFKMYFLMIVAFGFFMAYIKGYLDGLAAHI